MTQTQMVDGRIERCRQMNDARRIDITGLRCHALTVIGPSDRTHGKARLWRCVCDCGNETFQTSAYLRAGWRKSCGCMTRELISRSRTRHGDTDTPTWRSWSSMMDRCYLETHKSFKDYGGRGISVCERWHAYENFRADMGERPESTTLGRINNDGGYWPENCEWQSITEQSRNRRSTRLIEFCGEKLCLVEWAERVGLTADTLWKRIKAGWGIERSLTTPAKRQRNTRCSFVGELREQGHAISVERLKLPNGKRVAKYALMR
jgi:hypothetical protein